MEGLGWHPRFLPKKTWELSPLPPPKKTHTQQQDTRNVCPRCVTREGQWDQTDAISFVFLLWIYIYKKQEYVRSFAQTIHLFD